MSVINISEIQSVVYVVLGIDSQANDQLLAVCQTYADAKNYCIRCLVDSEFYDVWIEKHSVICGDAQPSS